MLVGLVGRHSVRTFLVCLLVMVLAGLGWAPASQTGATAAPDQIRLSWSDDPATTIAATWRSVSSAAGPYRLQWGRESGVYEGEQVAANEPAPGRRGTLHKARLRGLQPDTAYVYRVSGDGGVWSPELTFRTAPQTMPADGFVFTVNGDVGTSRAYPDVGKVLARVGEESPAFHVIAGDITYANLGGGTETEEYFFAVDLPDLASRRPVMVAWGNHEYVERLDVGIFTITRYFQLPTNGRASCNNPFPYYAFRYGGVLFVALDDPASVCFDQVGQGAWLADQLQQAQGDPTVRWRVVFLHQPPFASGSNAAQPRNRYQAFDQYHVDLVVAGHNHEYERTWPTDWEGGRVESSYRAPSFPTYLIVGTGGSPTSTKRSPPNAWSAFREDGQTVGYLRVRAHPDWLLGEYLGKPAGRAGEFKVVDRFVITSSADMAGPSAPPVVEDEQE